MALFPEVDTEKAIAQTEKAFAIPLGAASPLWFAYAGMTGAGMAYWWLSQFSKPANLEAFAGFWETKATEVTAGIAKVAEEPIWQPEPAFADEFIPDVSEIAAPEPVAAVEAVVVAEEALVEAALEPVTEAIEIVAETVPALVEAAADDLTKLIGIGPTLASKLADLGVTTFADIAAWTDSDIETYDKSLKLMGRVVRERWLEQARQLSEG